MSIIGQTFEEETWGDSLARGQVNRLPERFTWGTGDRRQLWMGHSHSCYIYETWRSKEEGGREKGFKVIIWSKLQKGNQLAPLDTLPIVLLSLM